MTTVVFIPGILGSRLALDGEEVWPPKPTEVVLGYHRIEKLVSPRVVATGVIESLCVAVYGPMLDALRSAGVREQGTPDRLVAWAYDWRCDLETLARELAADLDALAAARPGGIVLVCHSMGGLIARCCLEGAAHQAAAWQGRIGLAIFMATPHEGAPLAVARATGTGGSSLGLSAAQLRQLTGAEGYPADYQLFPGMDAPVIWRTDALDPFTPQSLGDPNVAAMLGLNATSVARAVAFQAMLDPRRKPPSRRYFSIVSAAHETITRFDGTGRRITAVAVKNSGDGTVPIQSAAALHDQTAFVIADHMGVAKNDTTISLVLMLLGKTAQRPIVAAEQVDQPILSLSQSFIAANEKYEILIALPPGTDALDGEIVITRLPLPDEAAPPAAAPLPLPIKAAGPDLARISLAGPPLPPGQYEFTLSASAGAASGRTLVVSPAVDTNLVALPAD